MSSPAFAAAQKKILDRRHQREAELLASRTRRNKDLDASALGHLPTPLRQVGKAGVGLWDIIKGKEGTRPAFRVGQVDAELLDEELLQLLKGQVGDALKYYGSHLRDEWSAEILLCLRTILFKLSVWDHDASYGIALQNLRYSDARRKALVPEPPTKAQKLLYGLFTVVGRYGWSKWESWLIDQEGHHDEPSENVRFFSRLTSAVSSAHSVAAFASFLIFLVNGRYRTLTDRILRLRLVPSSNQVSREVSFEYLNRQLVWHSFTEFLLFLLPLVGISRWRRWLSKTWRKIKNVLQGASDDDRASASSGGVLSFLPERTCAICYQDQNPTTSPEQDTIATSAASGGIIGSAQTDVTNPYECIPCSCIYCFSCLAQRLEAEEGEGWVCLRCGELVKECRPWEGDVIRETMPSVPTTSKSVGFVDIDGQEPGVMSEKEAESQQLDSDQLHNNMFDESLRDSAAWSEVTRSKKYGFDPL